MQAAKRNGGRIALKVDLLRVAGAGTNLAVLHYEARRPRGITLVAGHGYSSSKQNLDFLCGFLAGHGFEIYSLDFPGHKLGASGGTLDSDERLIESMHAVVEHAREHSSDAVYTMGHSMGAMTALRTAAFDDAISGVISIATGYGRPTALASLQGISKNDFRSSYVDGLSLPELIAGTDAALDNALAKLAGRPALYIAAARDMMVNEKSVRALFDRAPEPKTFAAIASDHTTAADNARSEVLGWLNTLHPR
jgi:pimeloyl-ACP methyl ester carboxylesterase